jgi:hypothetical protein
VNNIHLASWRGFPAVYGLQPVFRDFFNQKSVQTQGVGGLFYGLQLTATLLADGVPVCLLINTPQELARYRTYLAEIGVEVGTQIEKRARKPVLPKVFAPMNSVIFGPHDFAQTVGFWLPTAGEEEALLLSPFISTEDFDFTPEEYLDLGERIEQTRRRYEKLGPVPEALESLNTGFFRHQSLAECKQIIGEQIRYFLGEAEDLRRQYTLLLNEYSRQALFRARKSYGRRMQDLEALWETVQKKLPKNTRRERKIIGQLFPQLERYAQDWQTSLPSVEALNSSAAIRTWMEDQRTLMEEEVATIGRQVRAEGLGLSPLTVNPDLGKAAALRAAETRLRALLREINEAGLYQLPVGRGEAATSHRQLLAVQELVRQLRHTEQQLDQLEAFYHRRHFWYAQPAKLRRLLAPLLDMPSASWRKAFDGWYFERCLEQVAVQREGQLGRIDLSSLASQLEKEVRKVRQSSLVGAELRIVIRAEADLPQPASHEEVLIDLSQQEWEGRASFTTHYAWMPLGAPHAVHLPTAGWRNPGLLFHQDFAVVTPPDWQSVEVERTPTQHEGRLSFAEQVPAAWKLFDQWTGERIEHLHVFIPASLTEEDKGWMSRYWDAIFLLADQVTLHHDWTANELTQALISDGLNPSFLAAAIIRAAEAAASQPFDQGTLRAIGREVRRRCNLTSLEPHPITEYLEPVLRERLPGYFFSRHRPWRDTFFPLEVTAPNGKKTILLPDGWLPGRADPMAEAWRQRELRTLGFALLSIDALALWRDREQEVTRLVEQLQVPESTSPNSD